MPDIYSSITPVGPAGITGKPTISFWNLPPAPPPPVVTPTIPTVGAPTPEPGLDAAALLQSIGQANNFSQQAANAASAPITDMVNNIVAPHIPLITSAVNEHIASQVADWASSESTKGTVGSSRADLGTAKIRGSGAKSIADQIAQLITQAIPLAQNDRNAKVAALQGQAATAAKTGEFGLSLRGLVSDEKFKTLSLNQQASIFNADAELKKQILQIDQQFQAAQTKGQMDFQNAQNDKDRAMYAQQIQMAKDAASKARTQAITKSLTTLAGMGVGAALAAPTGGLSIPAGMAIGGQGGAAAGDGFGFAMA